MRRFAYGTHGHNSEHDPTRRELLAYARMALCWHPAGSTAEERPHHTNTQRAVGRTRRVPGIATRKPVVIDLQAG
jgi:hypothetical protein